MIGEMIDPATSCGISITDAKPGTKQTCGPQKKLELPKPLKQYRFSLHPYVSFQRRGVHRSRNTRRAYFNASVSLPKPGALKHTDPLGMNFMTRLINKPESVD
jgi:hypothetical protein